MPVSFQNCGDHHNSLHQRAAVITKTKIISATNLQRFNLGNGELEVVSSFIFLGFMITENGDCKENIRKRLTSGRAASSGLVGHAMERK